MSLCAHLASVGTVSIPFLRYVPLVKTLLCLIKQYDNSLQFTLKLLNLYPEGAFGKKV